MVTFALLERVKAASAPKGEALADDVVLSSVSGKLSGARLPRFARCVGTAESRSPQLSNFWAHWTSHGAQLTPSSPSRAQPLRVPMHAADMRAACEVSRAKNAWLHAAHTCLRSS